MKTIITLLIIIAFNKVMLAQKPANGSYTYKLCYKGWLRCFNTCTVIVKDDTITIYANEDLSVPKGEIIEKGIMILHKSGKWIIGNRADDKDAPQIGGCGSGPAIIDFKNRRFWSC